MHTIGIDWYNARRLNGIDGEDNVMLFGKLADGPKVRPEACQELDITDENRPCS
jgi:hypothetical protein